MATLTAVNPTLVKGPTPDLVDKVIASGQSWKKDQFLYENTSGLLVACASDADAGTGGIKYMAVSDQTDPGNSTTRTKVAVLTADHVFSFNELDGTLAVANIGQRYGIDVTSNVVTVDVGDTSNPAIEITELAVDYDPANNDPADVKARCRGRIITTVLEAAPA